MNRRDFLATAASTIITPLAAAVVTTKTVVTNAAWTDLGAGPMLLNIKGEGVYAIGDTMPSLANEGFTIKKGDSLPLSTTSHVWVRATTNSGISVYATAINGGGATSVWSAADAAANGMTLSNGGLTVTPSGAAPWQSIRSSLSKTAGKLYVEFKTSSAVTNWQYATGMADAGFVALADSPSQNSQLGTLNYSFSVYPQTVNTVSAGFTSNYTSNLAFLPATGDVYALAIDFGAGQVWFAYNNTWSNASSPAAGTLPMISFTPATVGALFAAMNFAGANTGVWTLQATAASQKYAPPSGFVAWDGGS